MSSSEIDRKIAVIFVADVVGYSKHMEKDENATFKAYGECETILNKLLKKYKGSIFNTAGDSVLAEFPSAVNAVECAVDFQNGLKKRNDNEKTEVKLEFRIGINMGDVVMKNGNLLGDGVNIAARLEALAQPNGISISKSVYDLVVPKTKVSFNDLGVQKVKQNTFHAYDILLDPSQKRKIKSQSALSMPMLAGIAAAIVILLGGAFYFNQNNQTVENKSYKSSKPIILVEPFKIIGENNSNNDLGFALTDSMVAAISKFNGVIVLPSKTSSYISENNYNDEELQEKYNIDYTIQGSIQKIGSKSRITTNLNDLKKEKVIWSNKLNFNFEDIFDVQDNISNKILLQLQINTVVGSKGSNNLNEFPSFETYTNYVNLRSLWRDNNPTSHAKAWKILSNLEEEMPNSPILNNFKAWLLMQGIWFGYSTEPKKDEQEMILLTKTVIEERGNFEDFTLKSAIELWHTSKDCSIVIKDINKSLELGYNFDTLYVASPVLSLCGEIEKAIKYSRLGLQLLPHDPNWSMTSVLVSSLYILEKYDEIIEIIEDKINSPDMNGLILLVYSSSQIESGNKKMGELAFYRALDEGRISKKRISTRMFPTGNTAERLIASLEKIGPIPD